MGKDFLKTIIEHKKDEISDYKKKYPENRIRDDAEKSGYKTRSFIDAFKESGPSNINIIAEIKRASPSKGDIKPDLDAADYAKNYEQGGASAISVLTDSCFFKGSFEDFKTARENTSLPMLRKDFIISSYQIFQSAVVLEADALLLIARILSKEQLKDYLSLTHELGMKALVEIHSEKDLTAAFLANAKIIGINNRNLSTFDTDLKTAMHLVSMLEKDQIPIAASGIQNKEDIEKNKESGLYNFLIGESLVRADDAKTFLKQLLGKNNE